MTTPLNSVNQLSSVNIHPSFEQNIDSTYSIKFLQTQIIELGIDTNFKAFDIEISKKHLIEEEDIKFTDEIEIHIGNTVLYEKYFMIL